MKLFYIIRYLLLLMALSLGSASTLVAETLQSELHKFKVEVVAENLLNPWGIAFLPGGDILITERPGNLRIIRNGKLSPFPLAGLPEINERGQGGLMGITLHPSFNENRWIYLAYAGKGRGGYGTEVIRATLEADKLEDITSIFRALPKSRGGRHFGSRLVFKTDGTLFISLGDRGNRPSAQKLNDHRGSLIRVNDDGSLPPDNPFVKQIGVRPEIYSYGHRNIQGMTLNPSTGDLWTHEHGPQGGDELNIVKPGLNYGWPVITYGVNYGIGTKIGESTRKDGMEQPIHKWIPSIAPSGMAFYTGDQFPKWRGDLFLGSLKFGLLVRLEVDEKNRIVGEEHMLNGRYGRIRDVVQGPDGFIYLLTDERDGQLLRLVPSA